MSDQRRPDVEPDGSAPGDARATWERLRRSRAAKVLVAVVITGAVVIAGIGFAGSYAAVRELALHKGFGWFANVFPIGVDAGIVVLLALDLLLTWLRIPFPLLRQTAWLLTGATIAFNAASAWPDKIGVGMHAIIPVLFVVCVEAARHAIGRVADITADKHMESVRFTRWLLAPLPTFRLWRRMKLWELRSYEETIRREQDRLVYRAQLRARYGAAWRRRAPVEAIMPLRLAKYGVPLSETAEAGLQAAGIEVTLEWRSRPELPSAAFATVTETAETPELQAPVDVVPPVVMVPEQAGNAESWDESVVPPAHGWADQGWSESDGWGGEQAAASHDALVDDPVGDGVNTDVVAGPWPDWAGPELEQPEPVVVEEREPEPVPARRAPRKGVQATLRNESGIVRPASGGAGRQQIRELFLDLSDEQRTRSDRDLAKEWAPIVGLSVDTIRKNHLPHVRREADASAAQSDDQ